ncbi:hypothetical protein GWI33_014028 [Rhynchophorus ferrugineus]|uniref:Uncharacterized protein n=1 Tax=Rhynchophorus ferrugineus TaxID=354439 RepID=A0A834I2A4_RHYFE|nr:hypothetical protein GWI33_014028 [Rhynchophorus ferrugineus]
MGKVLWGSRSIGEMTQRQVESIRSKRKLSGKTPFAPELSLKNELKCDQKFRKSNANDYSKSKKNSLKENRFPICDFKRNVRKQDSRDTKDHY